MSFPEAPRGAEQTIELLQEAARLLLQSPLRHGAVVQLAGEGVVTIAGDLHDNLPNLARVAGAAGLDDGGHLVVQELIHGPSLHHGCDLSHRMLLRIAALVTAHPQCVHPLLGNHELAQYLKRGVSKGGGNSVEQFEDGLDFVFGDDADEVSDAIDAFILAMPLAVRTHGGVLCAHSMPDAAHMHRFDAAVLNRNPTADDLKGPFGSAYMLTWGRRYDDASLAVLADTWNVKGFVLGHMHAEMGAEVKGERAVILNSDHQRGVLLKLGLQDTFNPQKFVDAAVPLQMVPVPDGVL